MAKPPKNIAASLSARLFNLARRTDQPFDVLLTRFVHERLLYRLSRSPHADRFALKGPMLLTTWLPEAARGTRDLDLLGFGDSSEEANASALPFDRPAISSEMFGSPARARAM